MCFISGESHDPVKYKWAGVNRNCYLLVSNYRYSELHSSTLVFGMDVIMLELFLMQLIVFKTFCHYFQH